MKPGLIHRGKIKTAMLYFRLLVNLNSFSLPLKVGVLRLIVLLTIFSFHAGCKTAIPDVSEYASIDSSSLPYPNLALDIPGLSACTTTADSTIHLNSTEPVNIIVHGCYGSAGRFRALAQVFAYHGQQTVCFNYNDRDSLITSSEQLTAALEILFSKIENRDITIIGHSQGGLIARKALAMDQQAGWMSGKDRLRLVTISSPFAGISAADHCGSPTAKLISFGLVIPICKLISGDKWYEITHPSPFIQAPGELHGQVDEHVKIVTDETGSCRHYGEKGACIKDDFVFSLSEQYIPVIDTSPKVVNIEVTAGHVEIVGDYRVAPIKLISLLQQRGVMRTTPQARRNNLSLLLSRIYFEQ